MSHAARSLIGHASQEVQQKDVSLAPPLKIEMGKQDAEIAKWGLFYEFVPTTKRKPIP